MPEQNASLEAKKEHFDKVLGKFVDYHVFHLGVTVDDKVQNYGLSLIELFIVLMQLNDTIHEGDGDRNVKLKLGNTFLQLHTLTICYWL